MRKTKYTILLWAIIMFLFIMDAKTVISGAAVGIELCLYTVIPSLFPFLVISCILNSNLIGFHLSGMNFLNQLFSLPSGGESIFLLGLVSGYPVGAKCIGDSCEQNTLNRRDAQRMLGFCSNCGPSFIFGICGSLFSDSRAPWYLWGIQILSAILTGVLLSDRNRQSSAVLKHTPISIPYALKSSVKTIAEICGWVILFRVIIQLANRRVLWILPETIQVFLSGILELTNGCVSLRQITSESIRFLLCSFFLSFGGMCVLMQTYSVTHSCGIGYYIPGKLLQCLIAVLLSIPVGYHLFSNNANIFLWIIPLLVIGSVIFYSNLKHRKKVIAMQ